MANYWKQSGDETKINRINELNQAHKEAKEAKVKTSLDDDLDNYWKNKEVKATPENTVDLAAVDPEAKN